jgi:hypothetical protein
MVLGLAGQAMILAGLVAVARIGVPAQGSGSPGVVAFVAAGALSAAAILATSVSVVGDVAVARAALGGEGPLRALAGAVRSFLARPSAFLVAALAVWLASALAAGSVQGFLGAFAGTIRSGPRALLLLPEMALALLAALVAAAAELWRLAAVGVLALGDQAEREPRWSSLRSESLGILPPSQ